MAAPGPTDLVGYVFGFANAGAALANPTLDPYVGQEMLIFFPSVSSVVPVPGFQPMVSKYGPIIDELYDHPNLLFAFSFTVEPQVLTTVYTPEQMAEMVLVLNAIGSITNTGFR